MVMVSNPVRLFAEGFNEFFDDKEGANLSVLLYHILLKSLLLDTKNELSNKIVMLDQYRRRNLRKNHFAIGAYFIELLRIMVRADCNRKKTEQLTKPNLAKL